MNPLELAAVESRWARHSVGEKAFAMLGLLLLAISVPPLPVLPFIAGITLVMAVCARVPWKLYVALVSAPASFVLLGLFPLIFRFGGDGFTRIPGGVDDAATVFARCVVGMSLTMLFALTTPMAQLLVWLRKIGYPEELAHVTMVMYRMIGTLILTARTMWDAQARRLGHSSWRRFVVSVSGQAASLFVLSFSRARALQEGLELRAPVGATATLDPFTPARSWVLVGIATALLVMCAAAWL